MNNRERFLRTLKFETVDHPPMILPGGPWETTRKRWEEEGLPVGVDLNEFFDIEAVPFKHIGIETMLIPAFEEKILEETDEFIIKIDRHGVKVKNFKDESSMAEHLEYPIKGSDDLSWLKERLNWDAAGRINENWLEEANKNREEGSIVFSNGGMYFAFLNEHMGTDTLLFTYFDNPEFVHRVNEMQCVLCENTLKTVLPSFQLDLIGYHEDMAYKNGSLISPDMFREFMMPYYKRITKITDEYGINLHLMDSDGDIRELIPLWLECGISTFAPNEVAAGMDIVALREEYGKDISMIGGFDKRILASNKDAIKKEFERLIPVIDEGGYILSCDHGVPHDVSFENFSYLVDLMKVHFGIKNS